MDNVTIVVALIVAGSTILAQLMPPLIKVVQDRTAQRNAIGLEKLKHEQALESQRIESRRQLMQEEAKNLRPTYMKLLANARSLEDIAKETGQVSVRAEDFNKQLEPRIRDSRYTWLGSAELLRELDVVAGSTLVCQRFKKVHELIESLFSGMTYQHDHPELGASAMINIGEHTELLRREVSSLQEAIHTHLAQLTGLPTD